MGGWVGGGEHNYEPAESWSFGALFLSFQADNHLPYYLDNTNSIIFHSQDTPTHSFLNNYMCTKP